MMAGGRVFLLTMALLDSVAQITIRINVGAIFLHLV